MIFERPMILVGFAQEAKIARRTGWLVVVGGGTAKGAARSARQAIAAGARGLVSFGLAGGLDPALDSGRLIVPDAVLAHGRRWPVDAALLRLLGGTTGHLCLGLDRIAATVAEKRRLWEDTGAAAVDMESGAVAEVAAEAGVPFAVLRAICDPADRDLPPAAAVALDAKGRIAPGRLIRSLLANPAQIPALIGLARDAAMARRTLLTMAEALARQGETASD